MYIYIYTFRKKLTFENFCLVGAYMFIYVYIYTSFLKK
jgi:hypothetical protein